MPTGTENGISFNFNDSAFNGKIYYGFIPDPGEAIHPQVVFFKRSVKIEDGIAEIDIKNNMAGKYDFVDWQNTGRIRFGYRIASDDGQILYDGKIRLGGTGPFYVDTSIIEGPFINLLTDTSTVISFETNYSLKATIEITGIIYADTETYKYHEIHVGNLSPNTGYQYTVNYGSNKDTFHFLTAPEPGTRSGFTFAYASDSRANNGGGERDLRGTNSYMMKKIAALCSQKEVAFFQFTGDLIDGYSIDPDEIELEYANWKRTVDPFACYFPIICGIGNHELLMNYLTDGKKYIMIDKFPYDRFSAEAIFARNFVNPDIGNLSEDGAYYDPDPNTQDFPSYSENLFYYTYDNIAMIVLNSNYWYSATIEEFPEIGGNLHGYIMDNQLSWLKNTLDILNKNNNIDHVFATIHTPILPNGGHVSDDMWYGGNNKPRPYIAGKAVEKGIIERRDELLDLLMNRTPKVIAVLTGDEHNYNRIRLTEKLDLYPDDYPHQKLSKFRPIWLINNGAAGAPYYCQEKTPWSDQVEVFSVQNAVVFFHVEGESILVEVINPDTLEMIDTFRLL
jgi:hypothetical protein